MVKRVGAATLESRKILLRLHAAAKVRLLLVNRFLIRGQPEKLAFRNTITILRLCLSAHDIMTYLFLSAQNIMTWTLWQVQSPVRIA